MGKIVKYVKFPFAFSVEKLTAELNMLTAEWVAHFNTNDYTGDWSALPLRSIDGAPGNIKPENNNQAAFANTPLMAQCPYIKSVLDNFPCEHNAVRLLKMSPGAIIKEHRDRGLNLEQGEARIHVPITTNPQMEFYSDGERIDMLPGECWYVNFDQPHRLSNLGNTDRIHLVFDIMVNDHVREMFDNVPDDAKKLIEDRNARSSGEKMEMIKRLREMNTPVSLQLAEKMEAEM